MKTVIYIDIDGVINSLSRKPPKNNTNWHGTWRQKIANVHGGKYVILWSTELIEALNMLDTRDNVEFVFLTTWQESATTIFSPLTGLNSLYWDVLHPEDPDDIEDFTNWWKLDMIKKDLETREHDQFIWIDDDLEYEREAKYWLSTLEKDVLAIAPVSVLGITKKQIDVIINFIDEDI
jgi:hypothetical protein